MEFKQWLENTQIKEIPFKKLLGGKSKIDSAFQEVQDGLLSRTEGPLTVSRLDNPRGAFFLMNGYHRAIQAIMQNQPSIQVQIDEYIPRIERTGGAYDGLINDRVVISQYIQSLNNSSANSGSLSPALPTNNL